MAIQILSPAHEAVFDEQTVTDKQLNKLLIGLDAVAREYDRNTWGIPLVDKKPRLAMHKVIRDWLAALNQPANAEVK